MYVCTRYSLICGYYRTIIMSFSPPCAHGFIVDVKVAGGRSLTQALYRSIASLSVSVTIASLSVSVTIASLSVSVTPRSVASRYERHIETTMRQWHV